jgi:NDP-sugar pyrophosphorylase family protein
MIFAAGLGTRLGPLTHSRPKALVPIGGVPMIERVARRLIEAGVDRLIINTHHFADRIVEAVRERADFGVEVAFSHEPEGPLETGGGLRKAASLFRDDTPFFIHNVDVVSDLPLEAMYAEHCLSSPLATLAVMERRSARYLLFDDEGLFGRVDEGRNVRIQARRPKGEVRSLAFAGIHVVSRRMLSLISETGVFSILDPYLRLAAEGHPVRPFRVDRFTWIDVGKPEQLALAERLIATEGA